MGEMHSIINCTYTNYEVSVIQVIFIINSSSILEVVA